MPVMLDTRKTGTCFIFVLFIVLLSLFKKANRPSWEVMRIPVSPHDVSRARHEPAITSPQTVESVVGVGVARSILVTTTIRRSLRADAKARCSRVTLLIPSGGCLDLFEQMRGHYRKGE